MRLIDPECDGDVDALAAHGELGVEKHWALMPHKMCDWMLVEPRPRAQRPKPALGALQERHSNLFRRCVIGRTKCAVLSAHVGGFITAAFEVEVIFRHALSNVKRYKFFTRRFDRKIPAGLV